MPERVLVRLTFVAGSLAAVGACGGGTPSPHGGQRPRPRRNRRRAACRTYRRKHDHRHRQVRRHAARSRASSAWIPIRCACPKGRRCQKCSLVGPGNGLQNVFVYVKDGLGDRTFTAPPTPVVLDQRGCKYMPHVFGAQVGQPVTILNSDPHATQRPRGAEGQHRVQLRSADEGHGDDADVRQAGSHGAVPLRRARLDGGVRRHRRASVLRGQQGRRQRSRSKVCRRAPTPSRPGTSGSARRRRRSRWMEPRRARRTSATRRRKARPQGPGCRLRVRLSVEAGFGRPPFNR